MDILIEINWINFHWIYFKFGTFLIQSNMLNSTYHRGRLIRTQWAFCVLFCEKKAFVSKWASIECFPIGKKNNSYLLRNESIFWFVDLWLWLWFQNYCDHKILCEILLFLYMKILMLIGRLSIWVLLVFPYLLCWNFYRLFRLKVLHYIIFFIFAINSNECINR